EAPVTSMLWNSKTSGEAPRRGEARAAGRGAGTQSRSRLCRLASKAPTDARTARRSVGMAIRFQHQDQPRAWHGAERAARAGKACGRLRSARERGRRSQGVRSKAGLAPAWRQEPRRRWWGEAGGQGGAGGIVTRMGRDAQAPPGAGGSVALPRAIEPDRPGALGPRADPPKP